MLEIFNHQTDGLRKLNIQRIIWLTLSAFFVSSLVLVFLNWDFLVQLHSDNILRIVSAIVMIATICWWYWTMLLINRLIAYRTAELQILTEIVQDISELKVLIKK